MKAFITALLGSLILTSAAVDQRPEFETLFDQFFAAETPADTQAAFERAYGEIEQRVDRLAGAVGTT